MSDNDTMKISSVTPRYFVQKLYSSLQNEINQVFRRHFNLNDDFEVTFSHRSSTKRSNKFGDEADY